MNNQVKKVAIPIFVLWALFAYQGYAQQADSRAFSLQEAIDFALENSISLKNSQESVASSEARVKELKGMGMPQLSASGAVIDNYIIPTSFIPAIIFDPNAAAGDLVGVKFGTQYTGNATINLKQMIFDGSYIVGLKASKTYTELSRKDLIKTQTDVVEAIKKAYYAVLVNKERTELVQRNFQRLDSLLKETKALYENGFAEKIDVNRVQVQYNNITNLKNNASIGLEVSYNILKFQMGLPIAEPISLTDQLETMEFKVLEDDFKDNFQYSNRIEYNLLQVNKSLVELDIKNTKSQYLPNLDLIGSYGASYGTSSFENMFQFGANWRTLGTVGISASLPIFDGLQKSRIIQQKKSKLNQIENSLQLTKNQIDLEQDQASKTFETYVHTLQTQRENMLLSKEVYDVTVIKYQQGVGSNLEVIDADASYKEAQTNYYAALYDALIASVELEKAYGKLLPQTNQK
jgi:outer membrane protein TolC